MAFIALEKLHNLYDGYRQSFQVAGRNLLLFQTEGQIYLIENRCPHAGSSLSHSRITGNYLRCNQHGIEFDLSSGRSSQCGGQLVKYPVIYEGISLGFFCQ